MEHMDIEEAFHEANRRITIGEAIGTLVAGAGVGLMIFEPFGSEPTWIHESVSQADALGALACFAGAGLCYVGTQFRKAIDNAYSEVVGHES